MSQFLTDKNAIQKWLDEMNITNYQILDDSTVNVHRSVNLKNKNLTHIPIQFRELNGTFDCSYNQLTSLAGSPLDVKASFNCSHNQLTSLEGGPSFVYNNYTSVNNKLISLKGLPKETHILYLGNNPPITLDCFAKVHSVDCQDVSIKLPENLDSIIEFNYFTHVCKLEEEKIELFKNDYSLMTSKTSSFMLAIEYPEFIERINAFKEKVILEKIVSTQQIKSSQTKNKL